MKPKAMENSFNPYIDTAGQEQNAVGIISCLRVGESSNRLTQRAVPVFATSRPDQNNPTQELHDSRWAPFRDSPDQLPTFDSPSVHPSPSSLQSQISPQTRSYSWNGSPDVGGMWDVEGSGTTGHSGYWEHFMSPGAQVPVDQGQLPNNQTWTQASEAQSSFLATSRPTFAWTVTGNPSETKTPIHAPVAMSRKRSLDPQLMENSVRQLRMIPEATLKSTALVTADGRMLQPLPSQRSVEHSQSPKSNRSELSSPTQSTASDPGGTKSLSLSGEKRKKPRRKAHNAIERRYRSRLNEKIARLRDSIPSFRAKVEAEAARLQGSLNAAESSGATLKINKADVLEKATEYIKHLENANQQLEAQLQQALALSRENLQKDSPPSNYPLGEPGRELRPSLKNEHHSESWQLQGSEAGTSQHEVLQYEPSRPQTAGNRRVTMPSESPVSRGNISYNTFRRP